MASRFALVLVGLALMAVPRAPAEAGAPEAVERGLGWLSEHQAPDGSWGRNHTIAVTGITCLAYLAGRDDPYAGPDGEALERGLAYLLSKQQEGFFEEQGHTWIHGQGFATLALSEGLHRARRAPTTPALDLDTVETVVSGAVGHIAAQQSVSGGWWYKPGSPHQHEGSTTVCAVQALVSASNQGIEIDGAVLKRGFAYLQQCQNPDGGFDYMLGPGETSMKEGTAGDVATLGLMKKFDYTVMMSGFEFLLRIRPEGLSEGRFPYYGHFYGRMGLRLLEQEFPEFADRIEPYLTEAGAQVASWQQEDGSWPVRGWMQSNSESDAYATAFAALILSVDGRRLSVFHREPPSASTGAADGEGPLAAIHLRDKTVFEGRLPADAPLTIETAHGRLDIVWSGVERLEADEDGRFRVDLADGDRITGMPQGDGVPLLTPGGRVLVQHARIASVKTTRN